jgi:ribose 5-phosphate isomerase B
MVDKTVTIVVGSDHAGFPLKGKILEALKAAKYDVLDVGSYDDAPVDFPDIASQVTRAIISKRATRGLMVCGTGVGAAIAANKVPGIRAAVCHDVHSAHQSVEHDDVNVMCIGAQIVGAWLAVDLVEVFLKARFNATEDHRRRIAKLHEMDGALARR